MRIRNIKRKAFTLIELIIGVFLVSFAAIIPLLALWTDRSIEYWLLAAGKTPDCPYWLAFVASILFPPAFLFNIVTEVARLFM